MVNVALIFPGQGSQFVGMGKDLYDKSDIAKDIFNKTEDIIPGIKDVTFNGPQEKLTETRYCQPAIVATSISLLEMFKDNPQYSLVDVKYVCGLSLGEYSALVASGALSFEDAVRLIEYRGKFMDEACKIKSGSMAAVLGLEKDIVVNICKEVGIEAANFNTPEQIVITGETDKVSLASERLQNSGAKRVIPLDVAGAFHSSLMQSAADKFKSELEKFKFNTAKVPIISNVDAIPETDSGRIAKNLEKQIISSVQWVDTVEYIKAQGITTFIEIGPGSVLKGLLRKIDRSLKVYNLATFDDVQNILIES